MGSPSHMIFVALSMALRSWASHLVLILSFHVLFTKGFG